MWRRVDKYLPVYTVSCILDDLKCHQRYSHAIGSWHHVIWEIGDNNIFIVKVKKFALVQAMQAQRESRDVALLFL